MTCNDAIASRTEDQRLALEALVVLDFADEDHVVTSVILLDVTTQEMSDGSLEHRHPGSAVGAVHSREFVRNGFGELLREVVLIGRQHVDTKVAGVGEILPAVRVPRQAPEHQRRFERERGERIDCQADRAAVFGTSGYHGYAGRELTQRSPEILLIEAGAHFLTHLQF